MAVEKTIKYKVDAKEAIKETKNLASEQKKAADSQKQQQKEAINGMGAFGMSIGGLKSNFKGLQATGKALFSSIKTGLIATGIGAFLVAIGAVVTYFKSSKEAAEKLEVILATVGAAFTVLTERFAKFGGAIIKVLKGDFKGAATDIKDTFAGIGEEIRNDIKATQDLAKAAINLRDAEREVNVELAQRRAETSALKIIAEDVTKSTEERLIAAEKAFEIENDLLDKRVANAEEALRIQQEQMAVGNNMEEDLQKESELQIALANIYEESSGKKLEINNKINSIRKEGLAIIDAEKKAEEDRWNKVEEVNNKELELLRTSNMSQQELQLDQAKQKYDSLITLAEKHGQDTSIITEKYNAQVLAINKSFEDKTKEEDDKKKEELEKQKVAELEVLRVAGLNEEQLAIDQATQKYQRLLAIAQKYGQDTTFLTEQFNQQIAEKQKDVDEEVAKNKEILTRKAVSDVVTILGEESKAAKAIQVGMAIRDTYAGATKALAQGGIFGALSAGGIIAMGLANVKKIMATGNEGGGSISDTSSGGIPEATSPASVGDMLPNMEAIAPPTLGDQTPVQAYVVENDISNAQALQEELNIQATL